MIAAVLLAQNASADLQKMVATERAFSATSARIGVRDSFIQYFAPNGVMFAPGPVNAHQELSRQPKLNGRARATLTWYPTLAEISRDGSLGYSTGPYFITDTATKKKTYNGHFFSLWRRQPNGEYRVILDIGTPNKSPKPVAQAPVALKAIPGSSSPLPPAKGTDLVAAEKKFFDESEQVSYPAALKKHVAKPSMFFRPQRPATNIAAVDAVYDLTDPLLTTWKPLGAEVAASGDLGYTFGEYGISQGRGTAEKGYFVRVWRRQADGSWKVAIDLHHETAR